MVRRDPKYRDKFPSIKENRIASDQGRAREKIPVTCRIVVPLWIPTDRFAYGFSDQLRGLATQIEHASKLDVPDIERLRRIQALVSSFNASWRDDVENSRQALSAINNEMTETDMAAEEWFKDGSKMMALYEATRGSDDQRSRFQALGEWLKLKRRAKKAPAETAQELLNVRMADRNIRNEDWYKKGTLLMGLKDYDKRGKNKNPAG